MRGSFDCLKSMVVIEMLNVKDIFYVNFKYYYETDFITISEFFLKNCLQ